MDSLVTLVAPMWVNGMIVPCHTSLGCSRIYRDQYWHNNQPLCIYGDPAYPSSFHLQAPFSRQNLTPNPVNYNKAMSQTRVPVEWLFNEIETYFKFVSYTNICLFLNSICLSSRKCQKRFFKKWLQNFFMKFLKVDNFLRNYLQKQPPEVFCKKRCSYKFWKLRRKTPVLESLFNKVARL